MGLSSTEKKRLLAEGALLAILALAVRMVQLDHAPFIDELQHVLAAQSLLGDGDLTILDGGPYRRGALFTYLVAGFFAMFGESLAVGRLPAVLAGAALVCLWFWWLRVRAGRLAGWTVGLLLCFAPVSIYLSQWVRFYTLHALVFWLGALALFRLLDIDKERPRRPWLLAVGATACLLVAYHLQSLTLIGTAGLAVWVALDRGPEWWRRASESEHRAWIVAACMGGIGLLTVGLVVSGTMEESIRMFRFVDTWALSHADNERFYHWLLEDQYGWLWTLAPLAVLLAFLRDARMALLCVCVFGVAFVAHSLAAWKSERYLFYVLPALFGLWGLALGQAVPPLYERVRTLAHRIRPSPVPPGLSGSGATLVLVFCALFAIGGVQAFGLSRQMLTATDSEWVSPPGHLGEHYRGEGDWQAARKLAALADSVAVVVSSSDLKAIYYLDRLDYILYAGHLSDPDGPPDEFGDWAKVGRPVVSRVSSLRRVMECAASGLVVAEAHVWGWRYGVPEEVATWLPERAERVPVPEESGLIAYRWRTRAPSQPAGCREVPGLPSRAAPGSAPARS